MQTHHNALTAAAALAAAATTPAALAQVMTGFANGFGIIQGQNELRIVPDGAPSLRDESSRQLQARLDTPEQQVPGRLATQRSPRLTFGDAVADLSYTGEMTLSPRVARLETEWHARVDPAANTRFLAIQSNINDRINLQLFENQAHELEITLGYELDATIPGEPFSLDQYLSLSGDLRVNAAQEDRQIDLEDAVVPAGDTQSARFVATDDNVSLEMNLNIELRAQPDPPAGPFDPVAVSGRFWIEVRVVPAPGALALLPLGLFAARRRR